MPARVLVSLEDAYLTFGGKPLFEDLRLHVAEGDRICLVGRNGAGKTTLMRLIAGELELDGGKRFCLPGISIGYLAQSVTFDPQETVHNLVMSGLPRHEQTEDKHHLADIVIAPLGLDEAAPCGTLSGGQLRRAALARALVSQPDVLMLDEPTNHMDLAAIEWLEGYLNAYNGAVICVSHDRAFLKNISRKVFWLDSRRLLTCPTGYAGFEEWSQALVEQEARELQNMQKKLAAEEDWTQGGVSGRRKRNQRRLNELFRLRDKLRADKSAYNQRLRSIEAGPMETAQASKIIVEFKDVSKAFGEGKTKLPILEHFHLRVQRGDRIGVIGKNGSGKSTFIKLLTGELAPDSGFIKRGKSIDITYFDQSRSQLNPDKSLWDTLCPGGGDYVFLGAEQKPVHVCGYLKNFLFDPRIARDKVRTLSGGQQNRLMLAKALAAPGNVLILDEPTNDLDMDTLDMLQELLSEYDGTLIVVSHDRDFLDRTVTEVLAFEGEGKIDACIGGYSDWLASKKPAQNGKSPAKDKAAKPVAAQTEAPIKAGLTNKERYELDKLPQRIAALEKEVASLREELMDANLYFRNPERFDAASRRIGKAETELEQAELRWLELEEKKVV